MDEMLFHDLAARVLCGKATQQQKQQLVSACLLNDAHMLDFASERKYFKKCLKDGHTVADYWHWHLAARP